VHKAAYSFVLAAARTESCVVYHRTVSSGVPRLGESRGCENSRGWENSIDLVSLLSMCCVMKYECGRPAPTGKER